MYGKTTIILQDILLILLNIYLAYVFIINNSLWVILSIFIIALGIFHIYLLVTKVKTR